MPPVEAAHGASGFVFPNEAHVTWTIMIVLYPYITGLVAGAFIVASLAHLFRLRSLRPVARFALVSSFAFLLFATLPLLLHLGMPQRAFNIMITPSASSAMAGFGYVYSTYFVLLALEIWFSLRSELAERALASEGWKAWALRAVCLFDTTVTRETHELDERVVKFLASLGIPIACFLHGYVGFLFGSIKANPWWSTPLMFIIFLLSAIVSGISVLIFLFYLVSRIRKVEVDDDCLRTMANFLWGFMIVDVALEVMEVLSIAYQQTEEWEPLSILIRDKLFLSYVVVQLLVCSLLPFLFLGYNALLRPKPGTARVLVVSSALLLLLQVLAMRWNVVIGGQLLSKSMRGYTTYMPGVFDKEGLIVAAIIFTVPFLLLRLADAVVPLFPADTPLGRWRARAAPGGGRPEKDR
jgi:Ni/Fe-hydrogenase subunit HybB-like protein